MSVTIYAQAVPTEWVTLVQNLGFPMAVILIVLAAGGWFYSKKVWPARQAEKQRQQDFWERQYDTALKQISEAIQASSRVSTQIEQHLIQQRNEQKESFKEIIAEIRASRNPQR